MFNIIKRIWLFFVFLKLINMYYAYRIWKWSSINVV
jgi:hypothetical protein